MSFSFLHCTLCPRECGADRTVHRGVCGESKDMRVAKIMLHRYEEPPISGTNGSGAIFFYGCNLRCGYCQNSEISAPGNYAYGGEEIFTEKRLGEKMLGLQELGAHNINLVTAAHFLPQVAETLKAYKPKLHIPIVYNSSGYEKVEALEMLDGLVDVYLPDFKYMSGEVAEKYSHAPDYPEIAKAAIAEMVRQTGEYRQKENIAVRGTIIRHLVLPGQSVEGVKIMHYICEHFPGARVSVMRQYTPSFNKTGDRTLDRKVTALEYNRVLGAAIECGLEGFSQLPESATEIYTPDFGKRSD